MEFVMERVELQYAVVFVFILWKEMFKIPEYWKMYIRQTFYNRCKYTSSLTSITVTINGYRKGFLWGISVVLFNNLLQRYLKKLLSSGHASVFSLKLYNQCRSLILPLVTCDTLLTALYWLLSVKQLAVFGTAHLLDLMHCVIFSKGTLCLLTCIWSYPQLKGWGDTCWIGSNIKPSSHI